MTKDGKPAAPIRFKDIVKERYLISRNMNTSYNDLGEITPTERYYLLEFINEELEMKKKAIQEQKQKMSKKKQ